MLISLGFAREKARDLGLLIILHFVYKWTQQGLGQRPKKGMNICWQVKTYSRLDCKLHILYCFSLQAANAAALVVICGIKLEWQKKKKE